MASERQSKERVAERARRTLRGIELHPHAFAVLAPALPPEGEPSHAYLFHGPHGSGKRTIAREFAAALLADGAADREAVLERVRRGSHPDLTWVRPSGAGEMLVADVEEPVVAAAVRTPFESSRRVFVIESAHTMNDQAANRMLKTLEEPPRFVHLLLLTDRGEDVMRTISSRCQLVRFDPLSPAAIAARLRDEDGSSADARADACARLALGDASTAKLLASEAGTMLRGSAERFVRAALSGRTAERPWTELLDAARAAGAIAGEREQARLDERLELLPRRERRRFEREGADARRRAERRARTAALDLGLRLAELWLRDVMCVCEGAGELVHAVDRGEQLREDAAGCEPARVREAVALAADTRASLSLNVAEELAVEALAYRVQRLLAA